jgi:alkaline phosphatase D
MHSLIGRTRTAPTGDIDHIRIAVVTGSNYQWGNFNGYARIADRQDLAAFIHTGDYFYEYPAGRYSHPDLENRDHYPDKELLELEDYRTRFFQYRLDPNLRRLHQQLPMIAQWDDHEHANDCWTGGAENHDPATQGPWEKRIANSLRAYYEWMPIRMRHPRDKRIYRSFTYGNLLELMMLELRLVGRDQQLQPKGGTGAIDPDELYDPTRTLLGKRQRQWLLRTLGKSKAQWKVLGSSVMMMQLLGFGPYGNLDAWDGYPVEREKIFQFIRDHDIKNFGVLSGDFHTAFAAELRSDPTSVDGTLGFEFTTPSMTSANLNEQEILAVPNPAPPPDQLVFYPLAERWPEGYFWTQQIENLFLGLNPQMKYINLDRHGYMVVDFSREKVQADWYYLVPGLPYPGPDEVFAEGWYMEADSTELKRTLTPMPDLVPAPEPAPANPPF